MHSRPVDLY